MLFEPYTRPGMLQRLDADFGAVCGSPADLPFTPHPQPHRIGLDFRLRRMDAADSHSASGRTSVRHSFHSQQQSISENFDREAARASRGSPSSSRQAGSRGGSCTRRPAASTASSGAAAKPRDHRFQGWPFKCSRAEFQPGKYPGANPTPDRIGHRRLEPRPASLWAIWPWKCFRYVCLPYLMARDMTLSSSAAGDSHTAARLILSTPGSAAAAAAPPPAVANTDEAAPAEGDDAQPQDPTTPPQAKSPQEIFNEMRRRPPQ